jgi:SPP1 gp7 family putative phage head morphogenesis protein
MSTPSEKRSPPEIDNDTVQATINLLLTAVTIKEAVKPISKLTGLPVTALDKAFALSLRGVGGADAIFVNRSSLGSRKLENARQVATKGNARYRVAFILNSARRMAMGGPDQVSREKAYWAAHRQAAKRRVDAAVEVDNMLARHGYQGMLGWHAKMDARTSAECRAAHGRNFHVLEPPVIGYPGSVHPNCRCAPGPVWPGGKMVNDSLTVRKADTASRFEAGAVL